MVNLPRKYAELYEKLPNHAKPKQNKISESVTEEDDKENEESKIHSTRTTTGTIEID